jgi:hypothetical protein
VDLQQHLVVVRLGRHGVAERREQRVSAGGHLRPGVARPTQISAPGSWSRQRSSHTIGIATIAADYMVGR